MPALSSDAGLLIAMMVLCVALGVAGGGLALASAFRPALREKMGRWAPAIFGGFNLLVGIAWLALGRHGMRAFAVFFVIMGIAQILQISPRCRRAASFIAAAGLICVGTWLALAGPQLPHVGPVFEWSGAILAALGLLLLLAASRGWLPLPPAIPEHEGRLTPMRDRPLRHFGEAS